MVDQATSSFSFCCNLLFILALIFSVFLVAALEITGENLEDLLAYDDLFLDYFNAFLALPVCIAIALFDRSVG